jgi:thiamine-phosphate pyrophosphorylase
MTHSEITAKLRAARLYAILDTGYSDPEYWPILASQLIKGGVSIIQLRAKNSSQTEIESWAKKLQPLLAETQTPFVINDYPEIALAVGADICHIGQDDLSVAEARKRSGGKIIGKSTHSLAQAQDAQEEGADYIGFGPLFATPTKPAYKPIGIADIASMTQLIHIPHFCIGGIKLENVAQLKEAGAQRVVIVSGLLKASDPTHYAEQVCTALEPPGISY